MRHWIVSVVGLLVFSAPARAGTQPANPPAEEASIPEDPEARRAYKIGVLERAIAEDKATIANPGGGKQLEVKERVSIAKKNLKDNQEILEKIKGGADMEVYFCSLCGREFMESGTCAHCKQPLTSLFLPGAKRPPLANP